MGKPKSRVVVVGTGGGGEEARPSSGGEADSTTVKEEGNSVEGEARAPPPDTVPTPAPRKRGRPRKVVLKAEESNEVQMQSAANADIKKPKADSQLTSPGLNGSASDVRSAASAKLSMPAPLRREGSRRKSEPRRAAD
eukprot:c2742_g1_i1 orf=142-555(+)